MATTNQKIRRLPGFRFEARAAARENILPRMDIALFVGFAASGPIGIPVVLDSAEQFNTIFGKSLPLVWNKEKGEMIYAYLAPTVRAFFRNGGKRCWVMRTARLDASVKKPLNRASYNFFPLPAVACFHFKHKTPAAISPAFARARSKGSWSDDFQVGTAMLSRAVKFEDLLHDEGQKILYLEIPANDPLKTGELLRLDFSEEGIILFLSADKIEDGSQDFSPPESPPAGKLFVKVTSKRFIWQENLHAVGSPNVVQNISVKMWTQQDKPDSADVSEMFLIERNAEMSFEEQEGEDGEELPPKVILKFTGATSDKMPVVGSLLVYELKENESLCMQVEAVNIGEAETQVDVELTCRAIFCRRKVENVPVSEPQVERLNFELWVKKDEISFLKLKDLEFNSGDERFWGNLPVDDDLYSSPESRAIDAPTIPSWTQAGDSVSFPLAGGAGERYDFYFPIFPTALPESYLGAAYIPGTPLQRDGLEVFDAALFLDGKLKNTGLNNLLNEGEFIRYLSREPRLLWGIHSALVPETTTEIAAESTPTSPVYTSLSLDEATIISVPDAVHLGWYRETDEEGPILQPAPVSEPPLRPEWWHFQDCRNPDVKPVSKPPPGKFLDCGIRIVKAPEDLTIKEAKILGGKFKLIWKYYEKVEDVKFVVEQSITPDFEPSYVIYTGAEDEFKVTGLGTGIYYFRVRAEIGKFFSDWSVGLKIKVPAADNWVANASRAVEGSSNPNVYKPDVLFAVQRALLRACAARGDIFAVLSLPEHYEKDDAMRHVTTLKATKGMTAESAGVEPFSDDELKALSFGALYHPWLITRENNFDIVRNVPASGAICGVMAQRAARRGAWIAPANEALQEVVGLATEFERSTFLDFQDGLINLVRQEPTGFMVLDSDTLSDDFDLRQINVRRLLSLLRRLALKHGAEYVFEPNNESFRRQVQRGFGALLDFMFVRGAFAGETPAKSYQVVVSETVNTFQSLEQGRFIVELRVAPSLPLKFVTVRLVQAGGRTTVSETV